MKGVLYFRLNDSFKARMWQQRRTMKDLDLSLKEAQNRWIRVQRARQSVPTNNGEFAARVAALKARIDALQGRLAAVEQKQGDYLAQVAVAELEQQKNRLATYQVQARFALASMYDRAANPEPAKKPEDVAPAQKGGDEPPRPVARWPGQAVRRRRASRSHDGIARSSRLSLLLAACVSATWPWPPIPTTPTSAPSRTWARSPSTVKQDTKLDTNAGKAMENYRRFLELQKTDPQLRAEAMRRLGDLNLDAGEVERMEKEVTAIDLQGGEAIKLYSTLLKAYPDYARNDQVLYQLARAYETTGQPEQALATLDRIVQKYPNSPQMDEVQFRRGELLFSAKKYAEAEKAYAVVIKQGKSSHFYEQSLYKHGWSLFKQSLTEESLPSFGGVLDAKLIGAGNKPVRIEDLKRADRELVEDTLRVMSITFSYAEGSQSLDQYMAKHGDRPYSYLLYSRLGDLYVDKQRFQDAATTYRAYVQRDPYTDHAPNLAMQAIEAYRKGGFSQLVLDGKHEYVEHYNFSSPFWKGRDRAQYPTVVQELKTNLKDVATYFHATAQKSKKVEDYQEAAKWYRDYLKSFPDDPDSAETNYLLAETLFESHQYADAGERVREHRVRLSEERQVGDGRLRIAGVVPEGGGIAAGRSQGGVAQARDRCGCQVRADLPGASGQRGCADARRGRSFCGQGSAAGDHPGAVDPGAAAAGRSAKQRIAWTIIAQSHFDQGEYDQAEPAFIKARELVGNDEKMRNDLTERLAATVYKQGEAKQKAGDGAGAVDDFLRVAQVAPDSKIRSTAEYDAAAQLINLKQWDRAITVLESTASSTRRASCRPM